MSFEWNLSSDEEDLEEWTRREGFGLAAAASGEGEASLSTAAAGDASDSAAAKKHHSSTDMDSTAAAASAAAWNDPIFANNRGGDDDDDEEESDVDWEDAAEDEELDAPARFAKEQQDNSTATSGTVEISLRPVTIHMEKSNEQQQKEEDDEKKQTSKKKKRKPVRRVLKSLPENLQSMLCNLQRTHLMTLTSHACYVSRQCSSMELMAMSQSIIPSNFVKEASVATKASPTTADETKHQHSIAAPTIPELKRFCHWYFDLIHRADYRLQARRAAYVAAGAPRYDAAARRSRRTQQQRSSNADSDSQNDANVDSISITQCPERRMLEYISFLAFSTRDDPQLNEENMHHHGRHRRSQYFTPQDQNHLLITMARSLGWRTRLVQSMDPIKSELDVDHPLLASSHNIFQMLASSDSKTKSKKRQRKTSSSEGSARKKPASSVNNAGTPTLLDDEDDNENMASGVVDSSNNTMLEWCEVLCRDPKAPSKFRWIMVDVAHQLVNRPDQVEILLTNMAMSSTPTNSDMDVDNNNNKKSRSRSRKVATATNKRTTIPYALAVEHVASTEEQGEDGTPLRVRFTDVTPRYAESYAESLKLRGMLGRSNRGKKVLLSEAELSKTWWATTLRKLNGKTEKDACMKKPPLAFKTAAGGGSSAGDAIVLDSDDDSEKNSNNSNNNNRKSSTSDDEDDSELDRKMPAVERNGANEQQQVAAASLDEALDRDEHVELQQSAKNESIPTSKAAFRTHPVYVIPSVLGVAEVLDPSAKKRVCGVFKGELVYRRQEVSTALVAKKWLYQGRQVRPEEMPKPIKRVKARKKPVSKNFKALRSYGVGASNDGSEQQREEIIHAASQPLEKNDGMDNLYAHWQTDAWSPVPIGPTDAIPVNEYKNVELALLNPGLVHIDARGVAGVAKKLGIPYAPCLLGFEGHGGNRTPTIRGIVVHEHNEAIMREASAEVTSHSLQQEQDTRRRLALKRWKKLFVGLLTKERLEREYGQQDEEEDE